MSARAPGRLSVEDWEIWIAVCTRSNNPDLGYSSIGADRRDCELMRKLHRFRGAVCPVVSLRHAVMAAATAGAPDKGPGTGRFA